MQAIDSEVSGDGVTTGNIPGSWSGEDVAELEARAGVYRLFSRILEEEVDAELLQLLRNDWAPLLTEMGFDFGEAFDQESPESLIESYAEEYTSLFMAPGGSSPFASVFISGRMFQEPADKAAKAYEEAGLRFQHGFSGEFPDHVGVMLAFIAHQIEAEAEALRRGDQALAELCHQRWFDFLRQQIGEWVPAWARCSAGATQVPFYQQICSALEQWLWQEFSLLMERDELKQLQRLNQREQPRLDYDADFRKASGL